MESPPHADFTLYACTGCEKNLADPARSGSLGKLLFFKTGHKVTLGNCLRFINLYSLPKLILLQ